MKECNKLSDAAQHAAAAGQTGADGGSANVDMWLRYEPRLQRLIYAIVKDANDTKELLQDTFIQVFKSETFSNSSSSSNGKPVSGAWLYRIAVNQALDKLRQRRRRPCESVETAMAQGSDSIASEGAALWPPGAWARQPDAQLANNELGQRLERAVADLPEPYRRVLLLRDVEGQSNDEVAESLGVTVPTVKARLHRARSHVRGRLIRPRGGARPRAMP